MTPADLEPALLGPVSTVPRSLRELLSEGPPVSPADLGRALGVTPRYVRKLIQAGALAAVQLPNAGKTGRPELGRWRIPRAAARALAVSLGLIKAE